MKLGQVLAQVKLHIECQYEVFENNLFLPGNMLSTTGFREESVEAENDVFTDHLNKLFRSKSFKILLRFGLSYLYNHIHGLPVIALPNGVITGHLPVWMNPMLKAVELPGFIYIWLSLEFF